MDTLKLEGYINEDGKLEIDLPSLDLVGKVLVTIESMADVEWTDEELDALLNSAPNPKSGAEIVKMIHDFGPTSWQDITDSEAWVEARRNKRQVWSTR